MTNYWHPVEEEWRHANLKELTPLLELTSETHALVARIANDKQLTDAPVTPRLFVQRLLLRRLGEELRAVELLAERGHGFQALSAACTLFEQSHFLAFATTDDKRASDFLNWSKPHDPMRNVKEVVTISGGQRGWAPDRIKVEYDKYRFLCGFKHNNPMFTRLLKLPVDPDQYLSCLALGDSNWFMLTAVTLSAFIYFSPETLIEVVDKANVLMEKAEAELDRLPTILPPGTEAHVSTTPPSTSPVAPPALSPPST